MAKQPSSIWKLTEDEERENDYKRLQKKFSFMNKNKPSFNMTKSTIGHSLNKSKKDFSIDFSSSNIIKTMNKDFCETSQSFKLDEFLINSNARKHENLYNININEPELDAKKTSESGAYENTERNMKNVEVLNNNTVLVDAMRKMSNSSSVDSIKDHDPANKSKYCDQININLNNILPSTTFMFEDEKSSSIRDYNKSIYRKKLNNVEKEEEIKSKSNCSNEGIHNINNTINKNLQVPSNIFFYNPEYNLSTRLLNDEKDRNRLIPENSIVKLLSNIREKKIPSSTSSKNFLKISDDSFLNILTFCFDNYERIINACKILAYKTHMSLSNKFHNMITQFREKYKEELELQEYYFLHEKQRQKNKNGSCLNLVLKSKIISHCTDKSVEINLKYKNKLRYSDYFQFTWIYDKRNKNDIGYWIASEAEQYENMILRYSYVQPLMSFTQNDMIEIQINIFSKDSIISTDDIEWENIKIENCPLVSFLNYEKSLRKINQKFDKLRFCEFENVIHIWKGEQSLSIRKSIEDFKKLFTKNFKIKSISYDIAKLYIFKVKMHAIEKGIIKKNKFMNFEMEIVDSYQSVCHEIKSLGVQNHHYKKFDLRLGTSIIIYFTDIYL